MKTQKNKTLLPVYLRGLASGKYTLKQASDSTGYSIQWLWHLKNEYKNVGLDCLQNKHKGQTPVNRIDENKRALVASIYADEYEDVNFMYFQFCLGEYHNINLSYTTVRSIMNEYGIRSPESRKIKKHKVSHRPRARRLNEGDLLQIDGTPFAWFSKFGDNKNYCMVGAIDDATSKITALYIVEFECLYGYLEILRQTAERYGIPREIYSDRAGIFCVTPKGNKKGKNKSDLTKWEELDCIHDKRTQWQRILGELGIRQILAWSPQAKGRVERMWSTLQGQLPVWFKKHGIDTVEKANSNLYKYIEEFNRRYSVEPASFNSFWLETPANLPDILLCRISRMTDLSGCFSFHSYKWRVKYPYSSHRKFELCICERGIFAFLDGQYWSVEILDIPLDGLGETMTQVLKNIVYRYMFADAKEVSA